jgi:hypothetical protein
MITASKHNTFNILVAALGVTIVVAFAIVFVAMPNPVLLSQPRIESVAAADLSAYHASERTMLPAQFDLTAYRLSERASVVNSLAAYFASERTMLPAQFDLTAYHLSEWFGK